MFYAEFVPLYEGPTSNIGSICCTLLTIECAEHPPFSAKLNFAELKLVVDFD